MSVHDSGVARPPAGGVLDSFNVNLVALIVAIALTVVGVKLTSFLPSKYYFSFSKFVDENSTSPFLISPPHLAEEDICKHPESNPTLGARCKTPDQGAPSDPPQSEEAAKQEIRALDRAVRQEAQSQDSFSNIIGFAIRLLIPALVGFFLVRTFGASAELAAAAGAAGAAILLCWPVIVLWKIAVTRDFRDLYAQFLLLYILGAVAFFYMAKIGAAFGKIMMETKLLNISLSRIIQESGSKILESALIGLISAVGMKFMENVVLKS